MQSISPVCTEDEVQFERVIALDQEQYQPLIVLPIDLKVEHADGVKTISQYGLCARFRFTPEERAKITAGADLILTELVFGQPFTPINFQFCQPDERPEF